MGHALLVMAAPGRQGVARPVQRLAQPRHVAVAEDRPDPGDEGHARLGLLDSQIPHQRLGGGQPDGVHSAPPFPARS